MTKPYNTQSLQDRLGKVGQEEGGKGTAGLYRHPESGQEFHTLSDPLFGEAQSNAAERLGFVRIRDSKPEEIHNIGLDELTRAASGQDSLKGLNARLDNLERVQEENKRLERELEELRAKHAHGASTDHENVVEAVAAAKADAEEQTQLRGEGEEAPKAPEAPKVKKSKKKKVSKK